MGHVSSSIFAASLSEVRQDDEARAGQGRASTGVALRRL
jgi:hypothetical protein